MHTKSSRLPVQSILNCMQVSTCVFSCIQSILNSRCIVSCSTSRSHAGVQHMLFASPAGSHTTAVLQHVTDHILVVRKVLQDSRV